MKTMALFPLLPLAVIGQNEYSCVLDGIPAISITAAQGCRFCKCTMACTAAGRTKVSLELTFVASSPQIYVLIHAFSEKAYLNISAKNAFRIIAPCDFARKTSLRCIRCTFFGRFRRPAYKWLNKNVFVWPVGLMHIC